MSALAKLMIPNVGRSSRQATTKASAASCALISRLVVVGRYVARRGHELAALALARLLVAASEEVRHMRVLLGLGDVQLLAAGALDQLRQRDPRPLGRERHRMNQSSSYSVIVGARRRPASSSAVTSCRMRSGRKLKRRPVVRADRRLLADQRRQR